MRKYEKGELSNERIRHNVPPRGSVARDMDPPTPAPPAPTGIDDDDDDAAADDDDTVVVKTPSDGTVVVEFPVSDPNSAR